MSKGKGKGKGKGNETVKDTEVVVTKGCAKHIQSNGLAYG